MGPESYNSHYSDQRGHKERGIVNKVISANPELSKGQLTVDDWIARRVMRRITQDGRR